MTGLLDPASADRLTKLCGMFGSDHDGERASAAAFADKLVRSLGLTWADVFRKRSERPVDQVAEVRVALRYCLDHPELLSDWELSFCLELSATFNAASKPWLTQRQRSKLEEIIEQLNERRAAL